ncbi:hypothetical protein [Salmonella phage vB_SpuS_Sp4]|nr:hypothetical protein [Salmonella phage vB_SpuS_Sp4]
MGASEVPGVRYVYSLRGMPKQYLVVGSKPYIVAGGDGKP